MNEPIDNAPRGEFAEPDRAAVMMMLLDEAQAAAVLSKLDPDELFLLGERMCALGDVGPEQISSAIAGFVDRTEQLGLPAHGRVVQVHALMKSAIGAVRADHVMQRIRPDAPANSPSIELVRWLDAPALIPLVRDEHPQALAVLLVQLDAGVAAQVLHALDPPVQADVVHRIATLGPVSRDTMAMLDQLLTRRIDECHGLGLLSLGGPREAAQIINKAGRIAEKQILPAITRVDKQLARQIEHEMFKFEHLLELDPQSIGALLREVESEILIDALKGLEEQGREVFFAAMSSRAADGVRDEIELRGRIKKADVIAAQTKIVAIARRLAADGTIALASGGGGDDYV